MKTIIKKLLIVTLMPIAICCMEKKLPLFREQPPLSEEEHKEINKQFFNDDLALFTKDNPEEVAIVLKTGLLLIGHTDLYSDKMPQIIDRYEGLYKKLLKLVDGDVAKAKEIAPFTFPEIYTLLPSSFDLQKILPALRAGKWEAAYELAKMNTEIIDGSLSSKANECANELKKDLTQADMLTAQIKTLQDQINSLLLERKKVTDAKQKALNKAHNLVETKIALQHVIGASKKMLQTRHDTVTALQATGIFLSETELSALVKERTELETHLGKIEDKPSWTRSYLALFGHYNQLPE